MKKAIYLGSLFTLLLLAGCSDWSKEQYISNFTHFVDKVEANYASYTEEDWYKKDKEFDTFTNERRSDEHTSELK